MLIWNFRNYDFDTCIFIIDVQFQSWQAKNEPGAQAKSMAGTPGPASRGVKAEDRKAPPVKRDDRGKEECGW